MNSTSQHEILIVDDSPKNIQVLGTMLKPAGYRIRIAYNGEEALQMVEQLPPDLILLDIMMPGMDGFDTCQCLKSKPKTAEIPVIFLTAKNDTNDILRGFDVGAVDYVAKPFNGAELLKRVETHLKLKEQREFISKVSNNRRQLIHVLCHDLANPLNAIANFLDLIPENPYSEVMEAAVDSCMGLISMVRKIRSIDEQKLKLDLEAVHLQDAVTESIEVLKDVFGKKEVNVVTQIPDDIWVKAERVSLINSVINNLLTNAIKFSYGGTEVNINAVRQNERVILTIQDFGIGMSEQIQKNLFNVSEFTNRPGTKGEKGTGFGLPLLKRFLDVYEGDIEIESKCQREYPDDHGTTVSVSLQAANPKF